MLSAPTVGVIVANHDNSAFVAKAIESVARQTVRNLKAIVIDDASSDGSDAAIRQCLSRLDDARFRYLRLPSNLGQAGAIRRGLDELDAPGAPFVCVLDSDDLWYEDFLARQLVAHLNADFPVALTYCDSHIIDADDRLLAGTAWWFDHDPGAAAPREIDASAIPSIDPATGRLSYRANPRVTFRPRWSPAGATNTMASMMLRRSFVDLLLVPPGDGLKLYVDFYLSTLAGLLTGTIAVHQALYAYRMHGRNKHSDANVMGGAYNSSTRPWDQVRTPVLYMIEEVLQSEAAPIRRAFGEPRHEEAVALIAAALGRTTEVPPPAKSGNRVLDTLLGKAPRSSGNGHAPSSRPGR
jgi:glycosyltransferase involved in cell wall biosynthesis